MQNFNDSIHKLYVENIEDGLDLMSLNKVSEDLGIPHQGSALSFLIKNMYECFIKRDASRILINPLVLTEDEDLVAANVRVIIDDNAIFRQQEMQMIRDYSQMSKTERIAQISDAKFVEINIDDRVGNIGVISNGSGYSLATIDYLASIGGVPMNFSDIGGSFIIDQVQGLMRLFEEDSQCGVVLVNLYGGILDTNSFAASIDDLINRLKYKLTKPMVIRLRGRNTEVAKERMQKFMDKGQIECYFIDEFDEVCEKAVEIANEVKR